MNKKKVKVASAILLPVLALAPMGLALQKPAFVIQKVQVLPLSPVERREYKGADTKVVVEVKHTPSLIQRPFTQSRVQGGGPFETYLMDSTGRKHSWPHVLTNFARRGKNMLVTYPIPLKSVPASAGNVTFVSRFAMDKEWQSLPISVVVR